MPVRVHASSSLDDNRIMHESNRPLITAIQTTTRQSTGLLEEIVDEYQAVSEMLNVLNRTIHG